MKILVRSAPGGAGHFVSAFVYSLFNDFKIVVENVGSVHSHSELFSTHNFETIYQNPTAFNTFIKYTNNNSNDLHNEAVAWFREYLEFKLTDTHIIRTHAININAFVDALSPPTQVINITITNNDHAQLCYNFVTKSIITDPHWGIQWAPRAVAIIKNNFPKFTDSLLDEFVDAVETKNVKFLCWFILLFRQNYFKKYQAHVSTQYLNYSWSDFIDPRCADITVNRVANFLNVDLSTEKKQQCIDAIKEYYNKQTTIPFDLTLYDFHSDIVDTI